MDIQKILKRITTNNQILRSKIENLDLTEQEFGDLLHYINYNNLKITEDIEEVKIFEFESIEAEFIESNPLKTYLIEISKYPLLTSEEEKDLAKRKMKGDKKAREQLIKSNLKLVVRIAKNYTNKGIPFLDLIQEGNIGLIKAVEKLDVNKGERFASYAASWIRQSLNHAIANQSKSVRYPMHISEALIKMKKVYNKYTSMGYEEKEIDKFIIAELKINKDILYEYKKIIYRENFLSINQPISFDEPDNVIEDYISDKSQNNTEELISKFISESSLIQIIETLSERQKKVILERFGFNKENSVKTLSEVGEMCGVTGEAIRQQEKNALKKIKIKLQTEKNKY